MFARFYKFEHNFVLVNVTQNVDDDQLRQHVLDYNREVGDRQGLLELADCRGMTDVQHLTVQGCIECAFLERESPRVVGGKLAVLVTSPLHYGIARAYASIAELNRGSAQVFYALEEALDWLDVGLSAAEVEAFIATAGQG